MLLSVDQASFFAIFEVNAIDFPSGDQANSSCPPKGIVGLSASSPFMTSTGLPPFIGQTKMWLRFPSYQASQCLIISRSKTRAFTGSSLFSLSRFAVHDRSGQSGSTSAENASRDPSGDHCTLSTSTGKSVTCRASPPAVSIVHTWDEPPRSETNAIVLPSGDQRGAVSEARALVSRRGSPPSIGTIQRFGKFLFASASYTRRVNTTRPPSGEGCGDASRSIAIMSRTEK